MRQAKDGEVTLIYNKEGKAHPVALSEEHHQMLQILVSAFTPLRVITGKEVEYKDSVRARDSSENPSARSKEDCSE